MTDDILAQKAVASRLSLQTTQEAADLRRRVSGVQWQAGAGETFRRVIQEFARELDDCSNNLDDLATKITHHANAAHDHADKAKIVLHVMTLGAL